MICLPRNPVSGWFVLLLLVCVGCAVPSWAHEPDSPDQPDHDGQRSRRQRVAELLQEYLSSPGVINLNGSAMGILQGSFGDDQDLATATGSFDLFLAARLGDHSLFFIDLESAGGEGPNAHIPTVNSLNDDAGSTGDEDGFDRLHVREVWAEIPTANHAVTFTVGKIDLTNYFDTNHLANDETSQFITGAFVNSAALATPDNSPGVRMRADRGSLAFQFAASSSDNSGDRIFDQLFAIGGVGFAHDADGAWHGNYRGYGYASGEVHGAGGYGFSLDQLFAGQVAAFFRWSHNASGLAEASGVDWAWSSGLQFDLGASETASTLGAAFGETRPFGESAESEFVGELYLRRQINEWVHLSPHLQFVDEAGAGWGRVVIVGMRTKFEF